MRLQSTAFKMNEDIPIRYTGEGGNISPPLSWTEVPENCAVLALICEDPDAPKKPGKDHPFTHWLIFNIPSSVNALPEAIPKFGMIDQPVRALQGLNSFGKMGYDGPHPPEGSGPHRYVFTLYALIKELDLPSGCDKRELMRAMDDKILATAELTGMFERRGAHREANV